MRLPRQPVAPAAVEHAQFIVRGDGEFFLWTGRVAQQAKGRDAAREGRREAVLGKAKGTRNSGKKRTPGARHAAVVGRDCLPPSRDGRRLRKRRSFQQGIMTPSLQRVQDIRPQVYSFLVGGLTFLRREVPPVDVGIARDKLLTGESQLLLPAQGEEPQ